MPDKQPDFELELEQHAQDKTNYEISVNGWVWKAQHANPHDTAEGGHAEGHIWGGRDSYVVRGWVTAIETDGPADYRLDGTKMDKQDVLDYRPPRFRDGGSSGGGASGGSGSSDRDTSGSGGHGSSDADLASADEYASFFDLPIPNAEERRVTVADGQYNPPAIQRSILHARPEYSIQVEGNTDNPYAVDVSRANHNFTLLCKDEHFWLEGMLWGRTQFSGAADPYCRDMAFTDRHGKEQSALGGKRASGRFINCDIGHKNAPDEYAAYYYGGGGVNFDRGNTFRATGDAYIGVNNTVTLYISGNNEFASGDKEVVEGSGIYPSDLDSGMNVIEAGKLHDDGWL